MKTFSEFILHLEESATEHAQNLIKSGKYDPSVRGSGAKFKKDLIASGKTSSATTASMLWSKYKSLHPSSGKSSKPTPVASSSNSFKKPIQSAPSSNSFSRSSATIKSRDGHPIKVGDNIGFKHGSEQYGTIHKISGDIVHAKVWDSERGEHNNVELHKSEVWKE